METATFAESITGTDATRAISPDSQHTKVTYVSTQHQLATATQTAITQLNQTLVAGTYRFSYWLICQSSNAGVGLTFAVNYTGTASKLVAMCSWPDTGVLAALGAVDDVANVATGQLIAYSVTQTEATTTGNLSTGTTGVATINSNLFISIEGIIVVTDGGNLELWHGSETTNNTSVEVGSSLVLTRVN
jgi:hypothetical protein